MRDCSAANARNLIIVFVVRLAKYNRMHGRDITAHTTGAARSIGILVVQDSTILYWDA